MKTFMPKAADITRQWYVVDAEGQVFGRVASQAAKDVRDLAGHTAKHLTLGIDNIPLTGNVSRFRHERLQRFFLPK